MEIALRQVLLKEPILPTHHVRSLDVTKAHGAKNGQDVLVYNGILGEPGADSQSRVDVTCVHGFDEGLDGDLDTLVAGGEEVALPSHSLLLGGEPALRLLMTLAHRVAIPSLDCPGPALLVAANRHGPSPPSA